MYFEHVVSESVGILASYLIDNNASWLRLKFTQVYSTSFQDNNFKALQTFCTDILVKYPNLVFDSDDFSSFQENASVTLLKRDDLQIDELEIFHFINPSSIINNEHFAEISSCINRCSSIYDVMKIPFKFNLLLRISRDGFTCETFHQLCDDKPETVVVIKVNNANEIIRHV
ncbi:hypothetical protein C2G38_2235513 [Gigaspora rosea]|uniref:TLDc domain-containing protein n=1 Tax=Gigaspora rosea TaxID=44941 RepID=A0A397TUT7_9GLOM|nr:hypothetical protein C2G38_2235513 [Gigaspora rosea]